MPKGNEKEPEQRRGRRRKEVSHRVLIWNQGRSIFRLLNKWRMISGETIVTLPPITNALLWIIINALRRKTQEIKATKRQRSREIQRFRSDSNEDDKRKQYMLQLKNFEGFFMVNALECFKKKK